MNININVTGLDNLKAKAKQATKNLMNKPVPLGKTVLVTGVVIMAAEVFILRKWNVSFLVARK